MLGIVIMLLSFLARVGQLLDLGLEPHYLTDERLAGMLRYVQGHAERIAEHRIFRGTKWA